MTEQNQTTMLAPIEDALIEKVMKDSYLDYSMSVIVSRALPDVRDGLKPVHRRILHALHSLDIGPRSGYKKSARIVGEVIGKYHPHGDTAVYDTAVLMAQPWSILHPLIDGQGNFGSIDGDNPAAMRYTEMRMTQISHQMFNDINKDTTHFLLNYDGNEKEPEVLPVSYPNLWVNGVEGIAVGMASSIPPHNFGETCQAFLAWLNDPEISFSELAEIMPGPDFPTGGLLHGMEGYLKALETGRGKVMLRARHHIEKSKNNRRGDTLVITEIPYKVKKSVLIEKIVELVKERKIEGITDLRDESNMDDMRIVIETRQDVDAEALMLQLCKMSNLEISFNYNVCALVRTGPMIPMVNQSGEVIGERPEFSQPMILSVKDIFREFAAHRLKVIELRTIFELKKVRAQLHILKAFIAAMGKLDETIKRIRDAKTPQEAKESLMEFLSIDDLQAQAILELKLQRLTGMQLEEIQNDHAKKLELEQELMAILADKEKQRQIMVDELKKAEQAFSVPRRSEVAHNLSQITNEDLIPVEEVLLLATEKGYLKRLPHSIIKQQNRGTRGRSIMDVGEDDVVTALHSGSTHDYLIAVTQTGQIHAVKAYQIPETKVGNKGRHYRNIFEGMADDAHVVAMLTAKSLNDETASLVMMTELGKIKRTSLFEYRNATRANGVIGINLNEGDRIISAQICESDNDTVVMVNSASKAIHFSMSEVRPIGRAGQGVSGMKLVGGAKVIQACVVNAGLLAQTDLVCVGETGVGKRTPVSELLVKGRSTQGSFCFKESRRTGRLAAATVILPEQDLILFNTEGGGNRISGDTIRQTARAGSGSILMNNGKVTRVISVPEAQADSDEQGETEQE